MLHAADSEVPHRVRALTRLGAASGRVYRAGEFGVWDRLRLRGPISAAKGLGLLALKKLPLDYPKIANRAFALASRTPDVLGSGMEAFVAPVGDGSRVEKYFYARPDSVDVKTESLVQDSELAKVYFPDIALPMELKRVQDNSGLLRGPFIVMEQRRVPEGSVDLIEKLSQGREGEIAGVEDLKPLVEQFLVGCRGLLYDHSLLPDMCGEGNLLAYEEEGQTRLALVDVSFIELTPDEQSLRGVGRGAIEDPFTLERLSKSIDLLNDFTEAT